jgi:hypothetical protein
MELYTVTEYLDFIDQNLITKKPVISKTKYVKEL